VVFNLGVFWGLLWSEISQCSRHDLFRFGLRTEAECDLGYAHAMTGSDRVLGKSLIEGNTA
jgi:hypothetical protein